MSVKKFRKQMHLKRKIKKMVSEKGLVEAKKELSLNYKVIETFDDVNKALLEAGYKINEESKLSKQEILEIIKKLSKQKGDKIIQEEFPYKG